MKVSFITISNDLYRESRERLCRSALQFGAGEAVSLDFEDLKTTSFYRDHKAILDDPKGMGYWCWKPYIILEQLKKVADNDIVIYADAGSSFIDRLDPLIDICDKKEDILLFANGNLLNARWTKRECFTVMNADNKHFWFALQCDAALTIFKKTERSIRFVEEWLKFSLDPVIIFGDKTLSAKKDLPGFIDHRWDQSVLSILAKKYNTELYRMPSQFGNHYKRPDYRVAGEFNCINQANQLPVSFYAKKYYQNSPYFQLMDHHRGNIARQQNKTAQQKKNFFVSRWKKYSTRLHYFLFKMCSNV